MITNSNARRLGVTAGAVACFLTITAVMPAAPGLRSTATVDGGSVRPAHPAQALDTPMDAPVPMREVLSPDLGQVGADESWWQAVTADLARREYEASTTERGLQAPNRAHNLRTTFGERGIEVVPRTGKDVAPVWRFAWETGGLGRPGQMWAVDRTVGASGSASQACRVNAPSRTAARTRARRAGLRGRDRGAASRRGRHRRPCRNERGAAELLRLDQYGRPPGFQSEQSGPRRRTPRAGRGSGGGMDAAGAPPPQDPR
jgi:hypothetical protein